MAGLTLSDLRNPPCSVVAGMDDTTRHAHERRITEATIAILTAQYHGLDEERDTVIDGLDVDDARQVVRALVAVSAAAMLNAEAMARAAPGTAIADSVKHLMSSRPWLFSD